MAAAQLSSRHCFLVGIISSNKYSIAQRVY